jgi:glutathione S-transferase
MKLYITPGSPYARMARVMVIEKDLGERVEVIVAKTRSKDSPYYEINPSGRVPYLIRDDGVGIEESALICDYLDRIDGHPLLAAAGGDAWEERRLEALARSMLDGLAVWSREIARPHDEQSPTTMTHERARSERMTDVWEGLIEHPVMRGRFNMVQLTLACALGMDVRNPEFRWRVGHPRLAAWFERISSRPSFQATMPPAP